MNFKEEITQLENEKISDTYILKIGNIPVILTAAHTMEQVKEDGSIKLSEPFTKAIAKYVASRLPISYFIKLQDTGIDSNSLNKDDFKDTLINIIKNNNIKLVIDLHGAASYRDFDVEFGNLNDLSIDYTVIKELENSFIENGITNIKYNNPFKGGGITKTVFMNTNIDVIQIEINSKCRMDFERLESVCNSLIDFIKKYANFTE